MKVFARKASGAVGPDGATLKAPDAETLDALIMSLQRG